MNNTGKTFYLETLGCPRNEADSEYIINILTSAGLKSINSPEKADILIVNGCAFIKEAVAQSIDVILDLRNNNKKAVLVLVGCMAQRYGQDLKESMDEVDLFVGTGSIENLPEIIKSGKSEIRSNLGFLGKNVYNKSNVTPEHYRYIKIQEGCNFKCSFCVIPEIKGESHSKELSIIREEVSELPENVKEIIIIGQNTTSWGKDLHNNLNLSDVVKELAGVFPGWIRFLYFHPLSISEKLLETMQDYQNVVKYLDIPIQHISDNVLADMNRGYGKKEIEKLLKTIDDLGDFTLRSTFIVGYPTETENNFRELCSFVEETDIEHIGIFGYSHEEGSASFSLGKLSDKEIARRLEIISTIIEHKTKKRNIKLIGQKAEVLIDGMEKGEYFGRTKASAPDIDPLVWISNTDRLKIGEIYNALITDALGSDFAGEICKNQSKCT